jgi:hypothetical protein
VRAVADIIPWLQEANRALLAGFDVRGRLGYRG